MPFVELPDQSLFVDHNNVASRGVNLVLIHGAGGEKRTWPATWRLAGDAQRSVGLAITASPGRLTNHSIYAVDLPGHGRSPGPPLTTIAAMADCLEAFFEAIGLDHVIPVGHSMGGLISLELARRKNRRLAAQVIVASSARLAVTDQILDGLKSDFPATIDFIVKYSFDRGTAPFFPAKARAYSRNRPRGHPRGLRRLRDSRLQNRTRGHGPPHPRRRLRRRSHGPGQTPTRPGGSPSRR